MRFGLILFFLFTAAVSNAAPTQEAPPTPQVGLPRSNGFRAQKIEVADEDEATLIFDIPVAYNKQVQRWIAYYQGPGRKWFRTWLERSHNVLPKMQKIFEDEGLPKDLVYMAMIESGFSPHAVSGAFAVGPWQFIKPTAERFGLKINWWLDERKDFEKSTRAAAKYIRTLYSMFGSWYLVGAAYNTGENRVRNIIRRHQTKNFWDLVKKGAFAEETENYIPKLLAAALISKAPNLYGFRDVKYYDPPRYDVFSVPGGTKLTEVADALGVTHTYMKQLNPELQMGYVPSSVAWHRIRIPKGASPLISSHLKRKFSSNEM